MFVEADIRTDCSNVFLVKLFSILLQGKRIIENPQYHRLMSKNTLIEAVLIADDPSERDRHLDRQLLTE